MHHLCGYLLIGDGLKHGKRNGKCGRYNDANDGGPDGELSGNDFDGRTEEGERDNTDNTIPPHRNFRVVLHETRMNVALILQCVAESADDILSEPH